MGQSRGSIESIESIESIQSVLSILSILSIRQRRAAHGSGLVRGLRSASEVA